MSICKSAAGFALASILAGPGLSEEQKDDGPIHEGRPNILFIMADDHAQHGLSCYGSKIASTPNIDRIATDGMRFTRAFGVNSLCAPARACLITGLHSFANGKRSNHDKFDGSQRTFPPLLQAAGYQTAIVGKWHLKIEPQGFDYYNVMKGHGSYFDSTFRTKEKGWHKQKGYLTDVITDSAIDWLEGRDKEKPFFLMVHHKAPHGPDIHKEEHLEMFNDGDIPGPPTLLDGWDTRLPLQTGACSGTKLINISWQQDIYRALSAKAPKERLARTKVIYQQMIKGYLRLVASLDENVGRLLDHLEYTGLSSDTIVIYTSDNGFFLGDHGMYNKMWMYEESMRIPLLIRYPGVTKPGSVCSELVNMLDFAPTFLDVSGSPAPKGMHGQSILPLLKHQPVKSFRDSMYYHFFGGYGIPEHYGLRTKSHKLIHFPGFGDGDYWELFDLENDPDELKNLIGNPDASELARSLQEQLTGRRKTLGISTR